MHIQPSGSLPKVKKDDRFLALTTPLNQTGALTSPSTRSFCRKGSVWGVYPVSAGPSWSIRSVK